MEHSLDAFIHRKVVVLHEDDNAFQLARSLCEHQVGCVLVSDNHGKISGLITDRDLVCNMIAMNLSPETPLRELMTTPVVSVEECSTLDKAIELMEQEGLRRIPVMHHGKGGHQRCVGLVTLDDLIAGNAIDPKQAARIVQSQIRVQHAPHLKLKETDEGTRVFIDDFSQTIEVSYENARSVAMFIMSTIVRRLHYTAAVQFIMQTPSEFHRELLSLPAGPDRSIDAHYFLTGVSSHMRASPEEAKDCIRDFWDLLSKSGEKAKLDHILAQLPKDISELFCEGFTNPFSSQDPSSRSYPEGPSL